MINTIVSHLLVLGLVLGTLGVAWFAWFMSGIGNIAIKDNIKNWSWNRTFKDLLKVVGFSISMAACSIVTDVLGYFVGKLKIAELDALTNVVSWGVIIVIPIVASYYLLYRAIKNNRSWVGFDEAVKSLGVPNEISVEDNSEDIKKSVIDLVASMYVQHDKEDESHVVEEAEANELKEIGSFPYYKVDVSTPDTFYNAVIGKSFDEGFGKQAHTKGTLVNTVNGYIKVEDLKVGDSTISINGEINTVKCIWEAEHPVYRIRTTVGNFFYTPEHPIYVMTNRDKWNPERLNYNEAEFIPVKDLKKNDRIIVRKAELGKGYGLSEDEAFLYGMWLGDGCKHVSRGASYDITVGGRSEKEKLLDNIKDSKLSKKQHSNGKDWVYTILASKNPKLITILGKSGRWSYDKKIVSGLSEKEAKEVIRGYIASDGCKKNNNSAVVSSCSKQLLLGVQQYAWALGYDMSIIKSSSAGEKYSILGQKGIRNYDLYVSNINLGKQRRLKIVNGNPSVSVLSVDKVCDKDNTYHFEVSGDHTYLAENICVHNCVAGFKEFQYSLCGRYVAAGGGAKNYADNPSLVEGLGFTWHKGSSGLKNGDWGIFGNGYYGHVAMYYNGKWLGQNQSGGDVNIGSPFSLINMSLSTLIGYYRPNIYNSAPAPAPEQPHAEPSGLSVGDSVEFTNSVDIHGTRLAVSGVYSVMEISNGSVVVGRGGVVTARVWADSIRKVSSNPPVQQGFNVGDAVVPVNPVDYNGTPLRQYDDRYTISELSGDRAVLVARGVVWAAVHTSNLRKV